MTRNHLMVLDQKIKVDGEYISLTDLSGASEKETKNWIRNKKVIRFIKFWEEQNNPIFEGDKFVTYTSKASRVSFDGLIDKGGVTCLRREMDPSKSGIYAHDIVALKYATWVSPEFEMLVYQDYKNLRAEKTHRMYVLGPMLLNDSEPKPVTFTQPFYDMIYRMKPSWNPPPTPPHPWEMAHITNDIVYDRIEYGLLSELQKRNPSLNGYRNKLHHHFLSDDDGHPKLQQHLRDLMTINSLTGDNWVKFMDGVNMRFPKRGQYPINFGDIF